jgi:hypothetical protein
MNEKQTCQTIRSLSWHKAVFPTGLSVTSASTLRLNWRAPARSSSVQVELIAACAGSQSSTTPVREKPLEFQVFNMVVPSLSWQMIVWR